MSVGEAAAAAACVICDPEIAATSMDGGGVSFEGGAGMGRVKPGVAVVPLERRRVVRVIKMRRRDCILVGWIVYWLLCFGYGSESGMSWNEE